MITLSNPARVRVLHEPTGITITVDAYRQQHRNRIAAMAVLRSRLWALNNLPCELPPRLVSSTEEP